MLNSLFMLGSSYNKNRKVSFIFFISWLVYMISGTDITLGLKFPVINALVFIGISLGINLVKNRTANTILSVISILIWSIVMDTICYFVFPSGTQNLFGYIFQGLVFNFKYIFFNVIAICGIYVLDIIVEKVITIVKSKCYNS